MVVVVRSVHDELSYFAWTAESIACCKKSRKKLLVRFSKLRGDENRQHFPTIYALNDQYDSCWWINRVDIRFALTFWLFKTGFLSWIDAFKDFVRFRWIYYFCTPDLRTDFINSTTINHLNDQYGLCWWINPFDLICFDFLIVYLILTFWFNWTNLDFLIVNFVDQPENIWLILDYFWQKW